MSIRQRLHPTPEQAEGFLMHCGHARLIWNLALEQRNHWRPDLRGKFKVTYGTQAKELSELRKEVEWLRDGSSSVQQQALRDLDRAFKNHYSNPGHFRRPQHRRKSDPTQGFYVRDLSVERLNTKWATVFVPKLGPVKFRLTRAWSQVRACTSARVTLRNGEWHVALTCPAPEFARETTGAVVGLDRGVAQTLATSDGDFNSIPGLTEGEQRRFLALQRRLARQVKGSNRRGRTKDKLSQLRVRLRNRRTDWVEQTTTELVRGHDLVALEDLRIQNMVKAPAPKPDPEKGGAYLPNGARAKAALNRAIHASCWGQLQQRLQDKARMTPEHAKATVVLVDPRNTSRQCRKCGHTARENRQSQAVFLCVKCGHTEHADTHAAQNILHRALNPIPAAGRAVNGRKRGAPRPTASSPAAA